LVKEGKRFYLGFMSEKSNEREVVARPTGRIEEIELSTPCGPADTIWSI
jgi:hypothetical protein